MKRGFTLVELAIVLVIIGLLIGGILAAQSMISTAKVQSIIRTLQQYEIATANFHTNFKYYPGDSPAFIPPGNGDGKFNSGPGAGGCSASYPTLSNTETNQFWPHLVEAGMLKKNYIPLSPTGCGGTIDMSDNNAPAEINWPTFEVSGKGAADLGAKRWVIVVNGLNRATPYFDFLLDPMDTIAVEQKMGSQLWSGPDIIGIGNSNGVGYCLDNSYNPIKCTDTSAIYGDLYYFLNPL